MEKVNGPTKAKEGLWGQEKCYYCQLLAFKGDALVADCLAPDPGFGSHCLRDLYLSES